MRRSLGGAALLFLLPAACGGGDEQVGARVEVPGHAGAFKTAAALRVERRAYDGAPPVIPHPAFGADCMSCHTPRGLAVEGLGFAPAMPHDITPGLSAISHCAQCHVHQVTDELFRPTAFEPLAQDPLRRGERLHGFAPPVTPHPAFMRENCLACHAGPGAREEIRTTHPERTNCQQCHVEQRSTGAFQRP